MSGLCHGYNITARKIFTYFLIWVFNGYMAGKTLNPNGKRIKPNITLDPEIWKEFKRLTESERKRCSSVVEWLIMIWLESDKRKKKVDLKMMESSKQSEEIDRIQSAILKEHKSTSAANRLASSLQKAKQSGLSSKSPDKRGGSRPPIASSPAFLCKV
jgi:hypothetical protein